MSMNEMVINLYLMMLNDADGCCTPRSVANELERMVDVELGVKVEFNEITHQYEVVHNG